uniref:F-box domain-containing protein n=1 Tax=Mycena chlorophos TaxID=658473 RepID=A0ABQ0L392_MYCCL|nr:predicted protein [Mycena chlorophos]
MFDGPLPQTHRRGTIAAGVEVEVGDQSVNKRPSSSRAPRGSLLLPRRRRWRPSKSKPTAILPSRLCPGASPSSPSPTSPDSARGSCGMARHSSATGWASPPSSWPNCMPAGGGGGGGGGKKSKKKKAKAKAIAQPNAAPWYELWGTYGDHPRYHDPFDSSMPPSARLVVATEEFESHYGIKNLQSVLPDVYHVFRILKIFVGAQDPKEGQKLGKGSAPADADMDEHMSDDDDFDGADDGVPYTANDMETTVPPVVDAEAEAESQPADEPQPVDPLVLKAQRFTDDPEHGVKVFLSSYFHDQGFIYNAKRITAAPHLLRHFLAFLARTSVIAKSDLVKALAVVERAVVDLPGTKVLSSALPDKFGRALVGVGAEGWGRVGVHVLDLGLEREGGGARIDVPESGGEGGGAREEYSKAEEDGKEDEGDKGEETGRPAKRARTEAETEAMPEEPTIVADSETREKINAAGDVEMPPTTDGGWGSSGGGGGGWGDKSGDGDGGWGADSAGGGGGGGWGDDDAAAATTAAANANAGFVHEPTPTLESVLGPLASPSIVEEIRKTLRPGFAERSMRRLTGVTLPNTGGDSEAALPLAKLTFAPWLEWKSSTDSSHNAPNLVRPSESSSPHDMEKDSITVLVSLEAGEAVKPYVGMGVWGTWVRVERVEDEKVPVGEGEGEGGKVVQGMEGKWYVEDVMMVIPSYWANEDLSSPLMSASASSPFLPPELEQRIFCSLAYEQPYEVPSLMLVAWRVKEWVEPVLYRTLVVGFQRGFSSDALPHLTGPTLPKVLHTPRLRTLLGTAVRNLLIDEGYDITRKYVAEVLSLCHNVQNLVLLPHVAMHGTLDHLRELKQLQCRLALFFECETDVRVAHHPALAQLTHLEVFDIEPLQNLEAWSQILALPSLTHLAISSGSSPYLVGQPTDLLLGALHPRGKLQAFVVIYYSITPSRDPQGKVEQRLQENPSFVALSNLEMWSLRWGNATLRFEDDLWTQADKHILRRRAGETEARYY